MMNDSVDANKLLHLQGLVWKGGSPDLKHEKKPKRRSVLVYGERLVFVGKTEEAESIISSQKFSTKCEKIVLGDNHLCIPGFQDAHAHVMLAGTQQLGCVLDSNQGLETALNTIHQC